jgi:hypothetical protein
MSRRTTLPSQAQVDAALAQLTADTESAGTRPSAIELARRLGLANATFWRHYPDTARALADRRRNATPPAGATPTQPESLRNENAELRRKNADLMAQLQLAIAAVQRLSIENHQLRQELEAVTNITRLDTRPTSRA